MSSEDEAIEILLTRPQKVAVTSMTRLGYSRKAAVRRLIRLGMLALQVDDLETDLTHGTRYALRASRH